MATALRTHLRSVFALDSRSLAAFRIGLACVVLAEGAVLRWPALGPFYSDGAGIGTLPLAVARRRVRPGVLLYLCPHLWSGSLAAARALWAAQMGAAAAMALGWRARAASLATCGLYLSATLRNVRVAFILDRCAPPERRAPDASPRGRRRGPRANV